MKFRKLALVLAIVMVLSMVPSVPLAADALELDTNGPLYAGYAKIRIDPSGHPDGEITGLPMLGYGASTDRLSTGGMDDTGDGVIDEKDGLFVTCIAITDQYEKTIIYYGIDIINPSGVWCNPAKKAIVAALDAEGYQLETSDLYMSASHTHNAPDLKYGIDFSDAELAADPIAQRVKKYRDWVTELLVQVSLEAVQDREEVILTKAELDVSDTIQKMNPNATAAQLQMNCVRHYKTVVDGEVKYGGSNFGYTKYNETTVPAMDPVDRMHLVQLTPKSADKDPIVLVNWDAHVTSNSTTGTAYGRANHYKISADWVSSLRYGIEAEGYRVAFSQSTGGNKTTGTSVKWMKNPDVMVDGEVRGYQYGGRLSEIVLYGLQNDMSDPLDTSRIRNVTASFHFQTNAPTPEEAALINALLAADPSTYPSGYPDLVDYLSHADTWGKRTEYYDQYPYLRNINSRYQLINARNRMKYLTTGEGNLPVGVLCIGKELSFVVACNELADRYSFTDTLEDTSDNDWDDLIDDTYGRPIVMGYTNGEGGYIPHQLAYTYNEGSPDYAIGSYEAQSGPCARYSGEKLVAFYDTLLDLLDAVNTDEVRYQCACGGKAADGENGHTCEEVAFMPWDGKDSLPSSGNYYLTDDIMLTHQLSLSSNDLRLDLNGYDIIYKVPGAQGEKAEEGKSHNTRVLTVDAGGRLFLTDSTDDPGTITRDLSELTEYQKSKITNYGLLVAIYGEGEFTMFDGILDATGMYCGGGGCVCVYNTGSVFTLYGGLLKGGRAYNGGAVFNRGNVYLYGGEVTGGGTKDTTGYPGVYSLAESGNPVGKVTVGGDVRVWDNTRTNGAQINIFCLQQDESLTIKGNFTGKIGVASSVLKDGAVVGAAENATIAPGSVTLDNSSKFRIAIKGSQLLLINYVAGDIDGDREADTEDVIALLLHVSMPSVFPIDYDADFTGDGAVTTEDVIRLLLYISMPGTFPL